MSLYSENNESSAIKVYEDEQHRLELLMEKVQFKEITKLKKELEESGTILEKELGKLREQEKEITRLKREVDELGKQKLEITKLKKELEKFNVLPTLLKPDGNKKTFKDAYIEYMNPHGTIPEYENDYLIDIVQGGQTVEDLLAVSYSGHIITKWNLSGWANYHRPIHQHHKFPMYFTSYEQISFIINLIKPTWVPSPHGGYMPLFDEIGSSSSRKGPTNPYLKSIRTN
jgi:hypothetical protein